MLVWDYRMLVSKRLETMFCAGCCVSRRKDNLHVLVSNGSETRSLRVVDRSGFGTQLPVRAVSPPNR
jgi:hypothetical protein